MRLVCEIVASDVLPALRALISKQLIEGYGLTQKEAARKLGLTQPAISQYKKDVRGKKVALVHELGLDKTALEIAKGLYEGMEEEQINKMLNNSLKSLHESCVLH